MMHKKIDLAKMDKSQTYLTPTYASRELNNKVTRYNIPENEMAPNTAYTIIHDELMLDGNSRLNLNLCHNMDGA